MAPSAALGWWSSSKVICPGYGFHSAACYGALQRSSPSTIIAWSGGTSTAALGFAIHPSSSSAFAAWVKTHPDYTWQGTAFEFYKQALSDSSVFSFLNSRLYLGMGGGSYYYLLHDFSSPTDMAKALCTSGGESFRGSSRVNHVDLSTCSDTFGGAEALWGGIPSHAKASIGGSSGYWVNVYAHSGAWPTPSGIRGIVNSGWSDKKFINTNVNFETRNCLCTRRGCTRGC